MEEKCRSTTGKKFHIHWTVPLLTLQGVRVLEWGGVEKREAWGSDSSPNHKKSPHSCCVPEQNTWFFLPCCGWNGWKGGQPDQLSEDCAITESSHNFSRLIQAPFFFTNQDQVMQLAHCLSSLGDQNGPMNGPKVDEVICKTLKGPSSDAMFHDIVIPGQELYYTKNSGANLSIMCRRPRSQGAETRLESGGFASEPEAH